MNERLPYEEQLAQQWSASSAGTGFPLPDVNLAWADMRRRLDEDEDRKPFAWWRWGCLGWVLLGLLIVGAGWYFLQPQNWFRTKQKSEIISKEQQKTRTNAIQHKNEKQPVVSHPNGEQPIATKPSIDSADQQKKERQVVNKEKPIPSPVLKPLSKESGNIVMQSGNGKKQRKAIRKKENLPAKTSKISREENNSEPEKINQTYNIVQDTAEKKSDPLSQKPIVGPVLKNDTVQVKQKDIVALQKPIQKNDSVIVAKEKDEKAQEQKEKTPFVFSAGLGLHQQIPMSGQTFTPYSSQGRKASLADYLPSVYLRLEKEKKWFLQGEFRYGAPQYTKQFTYRQRLVPDTGSNPQYSTLTSYGLKKTFYHQLPLTFHYFIRPGWSIGAGMQWNLFKSAIAEREVNRKNNFTQIDSIVSRSVFKEDTAGSIFKKTYWQAVVETQYKWKRFSFGARYAFGLQPYIQFTLPGQPQREERNHALQLFIRYELWRQKK